MLNLNDATPDKLCEELWLDFRLISTEAETAAARDRLLAEGIELTRCSLYDSVVDNRTVPYSQTQVPSCDVAVPLRKLIARELGMDEATARAFYDDLDRSDSWDDL